MALVMSIAIVCVFANATLSVTKDVGFNLNPAVPIKSLIQMAGIMLSQPGKGPKGGLARVMCNSSKQSAKAH